MNNSNLECIQLINTAIIKSREKRIDRSYEKRLQAICQSPALEAIHIALATLAEKEQIPQEQAAQQIIETLRELDAIWSDYVMMEGIDRLKTLIKKQNH